ncbi:PREDICTED: FAS1 domain-containing protein SELMODRAFT_448915 [Theobroma cacao]|uniref:FAS1 domain-containing protein SELMODRAFT_448915 n=1 Tax=Theobroma cacao TaxID=3641 RepID=A0AB32V5A6_THECC|nr:PREDICTED: FAS1 domain-containing protein SELMODRAFT_448915 [Theobroma cacao]
MATCIITFVLLMAPFQSTSATNIPPRNQDLGVAIEEMQKANYFTFVMLINMFPLDSKIHGNVTFLMPNDRMLSKTIIPESAVSSFLYRHSIPSPLLFENLQYIPTGSILPSSEPQYTLKISNGGGRRSFFLNNVRIISPNLCTASSSIRCHGIDGVLTAVKLPGSNTPLSTCSNSTGSAASPSPVAAPPSPAPILPFSDDSPVPAPQPAESSQNKSGASQFLSDSKLLKFTGTLLVVSIIGVSM